MFFEERFDFLSNFYPCEIEYNCRVFQSSEAAYQAAKCINPNEREKFINLSPNKAKQLGKRVALRENWEDIKIDIMREIVRIKFRDKTLMNKLKQVKGEIVEDNWWGDTFWGQCDGIGENHLGKILMEIRDAEIS